MQSLFHTRSLGLFEGRTEGPKGKDSEFESFVFWVFPNDCPLIWMFCGKTSNREINRIHKRALRILFNFYEASFEELLQRNNEQTVHTKNLHKLMTEVYKSLNRQNPAFMLDLFIRKEVTYNLRVKDLLQLPTARTVLNG